ncbi:hypothetical protein K493DRAFT_59443 [Basidiobolus meristosporus CBS 931.73]|uniref:Uncharacterized protein n=1 Tax=Basidiobolus meristosporus CBS 931.73 TaxID=1314790 RepID=A0A1Y1XXD6_9FUNG|nr:hypothetical protein K493DRAFT_59443 [Basidiobolus meristosporus CBS 931.73]|eukprot:ORX90411.1 hypothetical protein K493DRAFT_59443 [Basidiobolus meristosporus CBS 931.73]
MSSSSTPLKRKPNHLTPSGKSVKKQTQVTTSTPLQKPRKKSEPSSLPPTPSTEVPEEKAREEEIPAPAETKQTEEEEEEEEEEGIIADDDFKELMQIHGRSKEELKYVNQQFYFRQCHGIAYRASVDLFCP